VGSERHAPAALPPKRPGTQCIVGWVGPRAGLDGYGKYRPPPGFDPRTVQPVASRCTDWAIAAHTFLMDVNKITFYRVKKSLTMSEHCVAECSTGCLVHVFSKYSEYQVLSKSCENPLGQDLLKTFNGRKEKRWPATPWRFLRPFFFTSKYRSMFHNICREGFNRYRSLSEN